MQGYDAYEIGIGLQGEANDLGVQAVYMYCTVGISLLYILKGTSRTKPTTRRTTNARPSNFIITCGVA